MMPTSNLRRALRWLCYHAACLSAVFLSTQATSVSAAVIDIDTFAHNDPAQFFIVPTGLNSSITITSAVSGVLGGERDAMFQVIGNAVVNSASGLVGNESGMHALQLATIGFAPTVATLVYDGVGSAGLGGLDLTSGGSNTRFELRFIGNDAQPSSGLDIVVTVTSASGSSTASAVAPNLQSAFTVAIPFNSFVGSANLSQVNSVTIAFNGVNRTPNVDFELDGITVVPEPSTIVLAMLSIPVVAYALRRRLR